MKAIPVDKPIRFIKKRTFKFFEIATCKKEIMFEHLFEIIIGNISKDRNKMSELLV